jgi:hypothetical protein
MMISSKDLKTSEIQNKKILWAKAHIIKTQVGIIPSQTQDILIENPLMFFEKQTNKKHKGFYLWKGLLKS